MRPELPGKLAAQNRLRKVGVAWSSRPVGQSTHRTAEQQTDLIVAQLFLFGAAKIRDNDTN